MDLNKLIDSVTPELYDSLRKAVELGKWDNGVKLSKDQVENSLQIIIAYDAKHNEEANRVGYVAPKSHTHCETEEDADQEWQTLNIKD